MRNKLFILALLLIPGIALGQGTTFNYQGQLATGGQPANGLYDFTFAIYYSTNGGAAVTALLTVNSLGVTNGQFHCPLDFGATPFNGSSLWLELSVKTNGGATYSVLAPRQALSPVPYAIAAQNLVGPLPLAQLPATVLTNGSSNLTAGVFTGKLASAGTQPLQLLVGSLPVITVTPNPGTNGTVNLVQGDGNQVLGNAIGVTISGGGGTNYVVPTGDSNILRNVAGPNLAGGDFSSIGGGMSNVIALAAHGSVIAGGADNLIDFGDTISFIGSGFQNIIGPQGGQNVIAGGSQNFMGSNVNSSVIAGGNRNWIGTNSGAGTIAGGQNNALGSNSLAASIVGGVNNFIDGNSPAATIGGGYQNLIATGNVDSTIAGGDNQSIGTNSPFSTIGGGERNTIGTNAPYATIPGGDHNFIGGQASFAAGRHARAINDGVFVWADSQQNDFNSQANNEFAVRATGGVRLVTGGAGISLDGVPLAKATNQNASLLVTGTLPDARLSPNVSLLGNNQTFAGINTFGNPSNSFAGLFNGDGKGLSNVVASALAGGGPVVSLNGLTNSVSLQAGTNITLATNGNSLVISSTGGGLGQMSSGSNGTVNVLLGSPQNSIAPGVIGTTVLGGGGTNYVSIFGYSAGGWNEAAGAYSTIAGGINNSVGTGADLATISGGGVNLLSGPSLGSFIGGGLSNSVGGFSAFESIVGGMGNQIDVRSEFTVIGGGYSNRIGESSAYNLIAGGGFNYIANFAGYGSILGGAANTIQINTLGSSIDGGVANTIDANSRYSTIPGGRSNYVSGNFSLAAGNRSRAKNQGVFIWADSQDTDFNSVTNNEFAVRAFGGVRLVTGGAGLTVDGVPIGSSTVGVSSVNGLTNTVNLKAGANVQIATNGNDLVISSSGGANSVNGFTNGITLQAGANVLLTTNGSTLLISSSGGSGGTGFVIPGTNATVDIISGSSANNVFGGAIGASVLGGGGTNYFVPAGPSNVLINVAGGNLAGGDFSTIAGGMSNVIGLAAHGSVIVGGADNFIDSGNTISFIGSGFQNVMGAQGGQNVIVGGTQNSMGSDSSSSIIGGGNHNVMGTNVNSGVIAGGQNNTLAAQSQAASILGGANNFIDGNSSAATIGGGYQNSIFYNNVDSVIAGGDNQSIGTNSRFSTISGGERNAIGTNSQYSMIPGGDHNFVSGQASFAAGRRARATNDGVFLWADSQQNDFNSQANNEFAVRASGGIRFVTGGAGLTVDGVPMGNVANQNASLLSTGTLQDARLSGNVALLNNSQTFTGAKSFSNPANSFAGNGGGLTNLSPASLAPGTADISITGAAATALTAGTATNALFATNFAGFLAGDVSGIQSNTTVSPNIPRLNYTNAFIGSNLFAGPLVATNATNLLVGRLFGNGAGLSNVVAAAVGTGTVGTAQLAPSAVQSSNIAPGQVVTSLNGLRDSVSLQAGANIALATNGSGIVVSASFGSIPVFAAWSTNGNSGNNPTNGTFLGTTDNNPLEFRVKRDRALRLEPDTQSAGAPNLIGGSEANFIAAGVLGGTVSGGGATNLSNDNYGFTNSVTANFGTVGGGKQNTAGGDSSTVSGGQFNTASQYGATVVGGDSNSGLGIYSTVVGGTGNTASGPFSFAAGNGAQAVDYGSFVWSDSSLGSFNSTGINTFNVRSTGGARFVTGGSGLFVDGNRVLTGSSANDGSSLINLNAGNIANGTLPIAVIPNLDAAKVSTGTIKDTRLSPNVALLGSSQSFTGFNTFRTNTGFNLSPTGTGPSRPVDIQGFGVNGEWITLRNTNSQGVWHLNNSQGGFNVVQSDVADFRLFISTNGFTGINQGSPQAPLHVSGNILGGDSLNTIASGIANASVLSGANNSIYGDATQSLIGAGSANLINTGGGSSMIGAGYFNTIVGSLYGFIGSGRSNTISGTTSDPKYGANSSSISGGEKNQIYLADHSFIGGGLGNVISNTAGQCAIVGGIFNSLQAGVTRSTIGGGIGNSIQRSGNDINDYSVIAGGESNIISTFNQGATISGGALNYLGRAALSSVIAGGVMNSISNSIWVAAIGGGSQNIVNGTMGTIPGGSQNYVGGQFGFAAGQQAHANHTGSFVWADSQNSVFNSTANDQVSFRCLGGVRFSSGAATANTTVTWTPGSAGWSFTSDRNTKERLETVDTREVLEKIAALPLMEWSYIGYEQRHLGPMAQDFHAAFPLNDNDKALNEADLHGVELAAIQGLNRKLTEELKKRDAENSELKARLEKIEEMLGAKR